MQCQEQVEKKGDETERQQECQYLVQTKMSISMKIKEELPVIILNYEPISRATF